MRGKLLADPIPHGLERIIPAHAGQTVRPAFAVHDEADHPRACGANSRLRQKVNHCRGSSPRMRGKLPISVGGCPACRIIPAHAGQTWWCRCGSWRTPDHPRACGANAVLPSMLMDRSGSSPRMRGKQHPISELDRLRRIIPAHAGQTAPCYTATVVQADHPRACGANRCAMCGVCGDDGSSPRMRGKLSEIDDSRLR